jgi:acylphosphatase
MVKIKKLLYLFMILVLILLPVTFSFEPFYDEIRIDSHQTINEDLTLSGANVIMDGIVKGDLYCAGANVIVNGEVSGTMTCAAANIEINGYVKNLKAGAATVVINGMVENFEGGAALLTINGAVESGSITSPILYVNGRLGNVKYYGSTLRKGSYSVVMDSFQQITESKKKEAWSVIITWVAGLIGLLLTAWVLYKRHPDITKISSINLTKSPLKTWSHGMLGMFFFIAGAIVLILFSFIWIKGVLIPLVPLLLLTVFASALVSPLIVAWPLGEWIGKKINQPKKEFEMHIVGIVCVYILLSIPLLNILVWLYVVPSGIGALIDAKVHPTEHTKKANIKNNQKTHKNYKKRKNNKNWSLQSGKNDIVASYGVLNPDCNKKGKKK